MGYLTSTCDVCEQHIFYMGGWHHRPGHRPTDCHEPTRRDGRFLVAYGPQVTITCMDCRQSERVVGSPEEVTTADVGRLQRSHVCGEEGSPWESATAGSPAGQAGPQEPDRRALGGPSSG